MGSAICSCTDRDAYASEMGLEDSGIVGDWIYQTRGRYTISHSEDGRSVRLVEVLRSGVTVAGPLRRSQNDWWEVHLEDQSGDKREKFGFIRIKLVQGVGVVSNFRKTPSDKWGEDVHAYRSAGRQGQALSGHKGDVTCVEFSPSGALLASSSLDSRVHLWEAPEDGFHAMASHARLPCDGESDPCKPRLAFAPDYVIHCDGKVVSLAFSPDGCQLATASGTTVQLWDVETQQPHGKSLGGKREFGKVTCLAFSPDGAWLAGGSAGKTVLLWDLARSRFFPLTGHKKEVQCVAFSPPVPGRPTILASGSEDESVQLWDTETRSVWKDPLRSSSQGGLKVWAVAFSPDGALLAAGTAESHVVMWDVATSQRKGLRMLCGRQESVLGVAFSPNGFLLAASLASGRVLLWEVKEAANSAISAALNSLNASGTSTSQMSSMEAPGRRAKYLEPRIEALCGHEKSQVNSVAWTPDGLVLASGAADKRIMLWYV